jgi:hypothetical protein
MAGQRDGTTRSHDDRDSRRRPDYLLRVDSGPHPTQAAELAALAGAIERWAADLALAEEPARFLAALESAAPEVNGEADDRR